MEKSQELLTELTATESGILMAYVNKRRNNWMNVMQQGNLKLPKFVSTFNLPAGEGFCINCSSCHDTCYAMQKQIQFSKIKAFRMLNYHLAGTRKDILRYLITKYIEVFKPKIVRIHESGDFISQKYINMWFKIMTDFPDVKFYGYTKTKHLFDFTELTFLHNCNIIDSFLGYEKLINYGTIEYCNELVKEHRAFICPTEGCMETCTYCLNGLHPCFVIHGNRRKKNENIHKLKKDKFL